MFEAKWFLRVLVVVAGVLCALSGNQSVEAQELVWAKNFGGSFGEMGEAIRVDESGNVYTAGSYHGTGDFDPGPGTFNLSSVGFDAFISKLDSDGNFVWAVAFHALGSSSCSGIALDADANIYATGIFTATTDFDPGPGTYSLTPAGVADTFVAKIDSSANFLWAVQLGGPSSQIPSGVAVDTSGNVYTAGYFHGTTDFDPGPGMYNLTPAGNEDVFVSKLDSEGNFVWAVQLGGLGEDIGSGIDIDNGNNVYIVGDFTGTVDFDPGPGTYNLASAGSEDAFLSKLDSEGNFVWARQFGSTASDTAKDVATGSDSDVYTIGSFTGTVDFDSGAGTFNLTSTTGADAFVLKLDSDGNFVWAVQFDGTDFQNEQGVGLDAADNVYATGYFSGTADFDPGPGTFNLTSFGGVDAFVSKLESNGSFVWAIQLGGTGGDIPNDIAPRNSDVHVMGGFQGIADFDPGPGTFNLTSVGSGDIFLAKLGPSTTDQDEDGFSPAQGDCNDNNASIYPEAPELCDDEDNQCPGDSGYGEVDELANIVDADDDGWACAADCDETDPAINPDALDCSIDGVDNNCNGVDGDGGNTVQGYAAFDVNPLQSGEEVRITNTTVELCEVDGSGNESHCRPEAVNPADGFYIFNCVSWGTYRVKTTLNWTDRIIDNDPDPTDTEERFVTGKTSDFNLSPTGGTLPIQPILFKLPVVFVHGANAGACLDGDNHPGHSCNAGTCDLYRGSWTTAFDRFIADNYVSFVADGLAPCEARITWCANGTRCLYGSTCSDESLCTTRCSDNSQCVVGEMTCPGASECPGGDFRYLHDYNAEQLAAYLAHVQSVLTNFTGGTQVPVDIVAHSMGGITTRDLIGSDLGKTWAPLIRKLVMLGTPNAGSVNADAKRTAVALGRTYASSLNRRIMWYFNQRYGDDDARIDVNNRQIPYYYAAGSGGPSSSRPRYQFLSITEPNPNDGIVGLQSVFDYDVSDSGVGFHGNARFRNDKNCQPPKDETSTDNCLIRIQADAYVCTPDDHSELQTTTATLNAVQNLLRKGSTAPAFPCDGAPAFLAIDDVPRLTRQSDGSLNPLDFVEHQHVIDNSTESAFSVEWQTGTFTFTLEDPLGGVIDPAVAATDPNIEYLDGTGSEQGSVLAYIIQNPMSGVWTLQITAGSDVTPAGEFYLGETTSRAVVDVVGASLTDPANVGNTVALTATLADDGTPITGGTVTALATDRLGGSTPLTCLDDGNPPDITAGNGVYTCPYGPIGLSGHHSIEFQAASMRLDAVPFERLDTFILSVNSTDASIDGAFSEVTPDVNSNSLYDSLNIDVDITVAVDGEYGLTSTLIDGSSAAIDHEVMVGQMLSAGAHTLTLVFDGVAIREHGVDGPYTLTDLALTRSDTDQAVCEEAVNAYTTASYLATDFEIRDPDGDGIESDSDNCPSAANPLQEDTDTDTVGNACDNCPGISNTGQADQDSDGIGDACDLCPAVVDAYQSDVDGDVTGDNCDPDSDNDGVPNASDCSVLDNTLWSSPVDVTDLSFMNPVTLSWSGQTPADGSTATFDVVKGDLSTLLMSAGNFSSAVCIVAHDPAASATDSFAPMQGSAFYYLVRPRTGCGVGSYSSGTAGERIIPACP